ncbi:MAG: hypothetical protein AAF493_16685 [Pseudomonadota bacterium]
MQIINPTFGRSASGGESLNPATVNWQSDPIVLFSNSKPNAKELLEGVRDQLGTVRAVNNIDYVYKNSASQPAPGDMIEDVATKYRAAILAIAD